MTEGTTAQDAKADLKSIVDRIERLEEEKSALGEDVKEVYQEAKGRGYDVKILRKVIGLRKLTKAERDEQDGILDTYLSNLGMS